MREKKGLFTFYLPLCVITLFILFPFVWTIITSLKDPVELFSQELRYIPQNPTLDNYRVLFTETSYFQNMINSLIVSLITVAINVIVATMASYALTRFQFRGSKAILKGILLVYMLPTVLFLTPLFVLMQRLQLLNTIWALVVSYCTFTIPFSVWLMVGFMKQLAKELEEAAWIDGCSRIKAFLLVCIPVLRPGLAATATYIFINAWNEYLLAVMFTNQKSQTLSILVASFIGQYDIKWTQLTAAGVMTALPVAILFILVQKNFVSGIASGAVKG